MYSIQEQECRMHFDSNTKKDDQPSATLQFTYRTSNDVLSEFSPDLKSSLYRRPRQDEGDMADNADPPPRRPWLSAVPEISQHAEQGRAV